MSLASEQTIRGLVEIMSTHDEDHSEHFWRKVAGRLHAFGPRVTTLLAEPTAPANREQLRQQQVAKFDDLDWIDEHLHHLYREVRDAEAIRARTKAAQTPEHDVDEREQDAEDRRLAEQRHDQHASENAPRVAS